MYGLRMAGLLVTISVTPLFADVSLHHFIMSSTPQYITCNWRVDIFCNTSDVINIHRVVVSTALCKSGCVPCSPSDDGGTSTDSGNRTLADYVKYKCENQPRCNSSLPHPGINGYNYTAHASIIYNCTDNPSTISLGLTTQSAQTDADDLEGFESNTALPALITGAVIIALATAAILLVVYFRRRRFDDTLLKTNQINSNVKEPIDGNSNASMVQPTYEQLLRRTDDAEYSQIVGETDAAHTSKG